MQMSSRYVRCAPNAVDVTELASPKRSKRKYSIRSSRPSPRAKVPGLACRGLRTPALKPLSSPPPPSRAGIRKPSQTRKCGRPDGMSVLPSGADIGRLHAQVRFVPQPDSCTAANLTPSAGEMGVANYPWPVRGNTILNSVKTPGSVATSMLPPCCFTMMSWLIGAAPSMRTIRESALFR